MCLSSHFQQMIWDGHFIIYMWVFWLKQMPMTKSKGSDVKWPFANIIADIGKPQKNDVLLVFWKHDYDKKGSDVIKCYKLSFAYYMYDRILDGHLLSFTYLWISLIWIKQGHKPPIWEWFILYYTTYLWWWLGDGLWHCFTHHGYIYNSGSKII